LERFIACGDTVLWRCPACGLYQYGAPPPPGAYEEGYHEGYLRHRKRKVLTASIRLNRIAALLAVDTPWVLDVGCSVGATLEAAVRRGWRAVGVDVSEKAIAVCRERGLHGVQIHGPELPFPDETFDVVTAWHVIEHVADVRESLTEWRRVLGRDGLLAIETPDASSPKVIARGANYRRFWTPAHRYTFSPDTLASFLREAGFELLRRPSLGSLRSFTPWIASYAVVYQAWQQLRRWLGIHKEFQIFARRSAQAAAARPALRIAA
jgi:SAM-dependent methyltransferase